MPADHIPADHKGRDTVGKTSVDHEVPRVRNNGGMKTRHVAGKIIEAASAGFTRTVQIDPLQAFHDIDVVGNFETGGCRVAETLHLHILAIVLADWDRWVDDVGDDHHFLLNFVGKLFLQHLQVGQFLGHGRNLDFVAFGLVIAALGHHHPNFLT